MHALLTSHVAKRIGAPDIWCIQMCFFGETCAVGCTWGGRLSEDAPCQVAVIRAFTWISPGLSTAIALQYCPVNLGSPQRVQPLPILNQDTIH